MIPHQEDGSAKPLADAARPKLLPCPFCGAPGVKSSHLGEVFCSAQCKALGGVPFSEDEWQGRPEAKPAEAQAEAEPGIHWPGAPAPVEDGKRGALPAALQAGADFIGDAVALAQFAKDHPEVNAQDCVGVWLGTDAVAHLHAIASLESMRKALEAIVDAEDAHCQRCDGSGQVWADGKAHYPTHNGPLMACPNCGGAGKVESADLKDIARAALAEAGGAA